MDRDKRWERIKVAYDALFDGVGEETDDFIKVYKKKTKSTNKSMKKPNLIYYNYNLDNWKEIQWKWNWWILKTHYCK